MKHLYASALKHWGEGATWKLFFLMFSKRKWGIGGCRLGPALKVAGPALLQLEAQAPGPRPVCTRMEARAECFLSGLIDEPQSCQAGPPPATESYVPEFHLFCVSCFDYWFYTHIYASRVAHRIERAAYSRTYHHLPTFSNATQTGKQKWHVGEIAECCHRCVPVCIAFANDDKD